MEAEETRHKLERVKEERVQKAKEGKERGEKLSEQALQMVKKRNIKPFWERWGDPIGYTAIAAVVVGLLILNYTGDRRRLHQILVNEDTFIQAHNEGPAQGYSIAANEHFQGSSLQDAQKYFANDLATRKSITKCITAPLKSVNIPAQYNFYETHPLCKKNQTLRKDSSTYVEAPLFVYSDRLCGWGLQNIVSPSVDFFTNCNTKINKGVKGGYLLSTLFFMRKGFIDEECWKRGTDGQPQGSCPVDSLKYCLQERLLDYCQIDGEEDIKREIVQNGPVLSVMRPYRDFLLYSSGIYEVKDRSKLEGIAFVKVVGWGENEEGFKYWLVDPMWGSTWGQGGVGRIKIKGEESLLEKYTFVLYPEVQIKANSEIVEGRDELILAKPDIYIETE